MGLEPHTIVIGTRGSQLALWQAEFVAGGLRAARPGLTVRLERIRTTGDKITDVPLAKVGGKSLFVKEIEEALLAGAVDVAVHSMKDVPTELPVGLAIGATPPREDPSDVLISRVGCRLAALPRGARVGTSSLRRQAQLLHLRPDLAIVPLRGNLDTRLKKLASEGLDAIVLALAGVKRLGLLHQVSEVLSPEVLLPAVGQGALGIEVRAPRYESREPRCASREPRAASREQGAERRELSAERRAPSTGGTAGGQAGGGAGGRGESVSSGQRPAASGPDAMVERRDEAIVALARGLDHRETHLAVRAERATLARLQGGCQVPIAAHAEVDAGGIRLRGLVAALDGTTLLRAEARGAAHDPESVGIAVAEELLRKGGRAILAAIYGEHAR